MRIKLKLAGMLFLFSVAFIGCGENPTNSSNNETPISSPKMQESNARQNPAQPNFNNIPTNETREYYANLANNNHLKTPLPKVDFPVVREANSNIQDEVKRMRDKEEVVKIAFIKKTNTVAVRLKSGIICEFPIEMMPKAKETPDEEVIKIVMENKNSKMCKDFSK